MILLTQTEKDLLLKDICARLPYGVKAEKYVKRMDGEFVPLSNIQIVTAKDIITLDKCTGYTIKPYLFSFSNIFDNEELRKEFDVLIELELRAINDEITHVQATEFEVDFYNKHHLDWRGLIPMSLANDVTGKNIY